MNSNPLQIDEYEQQSLYSFNNEHDACGVGLVLNLYGEKSHEIVDVSCVTSVTIARLGLMVSVII